MPHPLAGRLLFPFLLSMALFPFGAQPQASKPGCPDIPGPISQFAPPNRFISALFEKVSVDKNIVVGDATSVEGKRIKLLLDLYAPEEDQDAARPALLLIHGGGFKPGTTKEQGYIVTLARVMAQRGYVCAALEYRIRKQPDLDWEGTLKDCLDDVNAGVQWIRANAAKYRIDRNRFAVIGGSAGGMIGLNYVVKDQNRRGIFAFVNLWGSPNHQELWPAKIDACYPPTLIIHGTKDTTVPFEASNEFAKRLAAAGVPSLLVPLPEAPHTPLAQLDQIVDSMSSFLYERLTGGKPSR